MKGKSAVQKGKDFENFVVQLLRNSGVDIHARRTVGSGGYREKGDIFNNIGWHIECKNHKTPAFPKWMRQVKKDAVADKAMIVWHPPNVPMEQSIVLMNVLDFLDLLKFLKDHQNRETILDKYAVKRNLERATFHLKEVIKEL